MSEKILASYGFSSEFYPQWVKHRELQSFFYPEFDLNFNQHHAVVTPQEFTVAKVRNIGIDYAIQENYQWLLLLDVDAIILNYPSPNLPSTGFCGVTCFYDSPEHVVKPASWFLLRRDVFTRFRFYEGYKSWGFVDFDYVYNILEPNGVKQCGQTMLKGIHLNHGDRPWTGDRQSSNKELYESRKPRERKINGN